MKKISVLMATVFVDMLGVAMIFPLLPFYALRLHAEPWMVGWLIASFSLAQLASAPVWGRISDRYGRRPVLLVGLFASALAFVVFGFATSVSMLVLSRLVQGAGGGTTGVAQAYVGDAIAPAQRTRALGWLSAATSAGVMIGPVLGSLASRLGPAAPGLIAALLCLVNVGFAWMWLPEPERTGDGEAGKAPASRSIGRRVLQVLRSPGEAVSALIWIYAVGMLGFMSMTGVLALFLRARYGVSEGTIGLVFLYTGGLGLIVRGFVLGWLTDRIGELRLMRLGACLLVLGLAGIPVAPSIPILGVVLGLVPIGTACLFPATSALVSRLAPRDELGQTLGVQQAFGAAARVLAPILSTAAFQNLGMAVPFEIAGVVVAAVAGLAFRLRLDVGRHPRSQPEAVV